MLFPVGNGLLNLNVQSNPLLWSVDFSTLTVGEQPSLPQGLLYSRSGAAWVQTSVSSMAPIAADKSRVQQFTDDTTRGLLIEQALSGNPEGDRNATSFSGTSGATISFNSQIGPDGTANIADVVQVTSGGFVFNYVSTSGVVNYTYSIWVKQYLPSGVTGDYLNWLIFLGGSFPQNANFGTANQTWMRSICTPVMANGFQCTVQPVEGRSVGIFPAGARNNIIDMMQFEPGKFATSFSDVAGRNEDNLEYPTPVADFIDGGRFALEMILQPLGASGDYVLPDGTAERQILTWSSGTNNVKLDGSTLTITMGGITKTFITALTFTANQLTELFIIMIDGISVGYAARVGGVTITSDSQSNTGNLPSTGTLRFLGGGGGTAFSSVIRALNVYRNGAKPSWAP